MNLRLAMAPGCKIGAGLAEEVIEVAAAGPRGGVYPGDVADSVEVGIQRARRPACGGYRLHLLPEVVRTAPSTSSS